MQKCAPLPGTLAVVSLTAAAIVAQAAAPAGSTNSAADDWLIQNDAQTVPQVGAGELLFLASPPNSKVPLSDNRIAITEASLADGWVQLDQCYLGLDAVPETEVVYRYRAMRGLQIVSTRHIGQAVATKRSVELRDVQHDASLCIRAEAQILYAQPDGSRVLRNGPFHRKFLDGYFPLHVGLEVHYPPGALRYLGVVPAPQAGFAVASGDGLLTIDSWFAGALNIAISFAPIQTGAAAGQ
jgi:hypothetical protein